MKKRKQLVLFIVIASILMTSFSFYFYQVFYGVNILADQSSRSILIDNDDNFDSLRNQLYDQNIIEDVISFSFVSKALKYQKAIKPGVYQFESGMTNLEAIRMLRSGDQIPVDITFNNVRFKHELAEKISNGIGIDKELILDKLNDSTYVASLGFSKETIMSMFIPNTYEVYWTISLDELFQRMKQEFDRFWNSERKAKASELNLTPLEVSALASIVQSESSKIDESPKIAGLYLNRLQKNMYLQADPTVRFALGDFTIQRILTKDLQVESPYNTYKNKGLPPGPINLPTISSIDAVLNFDDHDYIYMCAKEDFSGYHRFAKTLVEHNRNARLFQNALNKRNIYR